MLKLFKKKKSVINYFTGFIKNCCRWNTVFIFVGMVFLTSCSVRKIVVVQLQPVIKEVEKSILSESEEKLAAEAIPFSIKFAEGLYHYYPTPFYSSKLALLYTAYAFAYVDDTPYDDFDLEAETKKSRAIALYKKGFAYGLESLKERHAGFENILKDPSTVDELLIKTKKEDVEALFWFNFSWAMILFNDLSDPTVVVNLETIKKLSQRIVVLDEGYYYGAAWSILSAYYGGRTASIGGDYRQAVAAYRKAAKFSQQKSLIPAFVMMRFVATQQPDASDFEKYYRDIVAFDVKANPSFAFLNTMLRRKADALYKKKILFFP